MSRFELYSPEGLRADGRRYNELRFMKCAINTLPKAADGSSLVEMGSTKVVCVVQGPQEPGSKSKAGEEAQISVSVTFAPFSTTERDKRPANDRRLQEMGHTLEEAFNEVVLRQLYPRTEIIVNLTVLEQDGGALPACVNAMTLALVDAGVPMTNYVSSCSAAMYDLYPLLDPNNIEENELPTVIQAIAGTSEDSLMVNVDRRMGLDRLEPALQLSLQGCLLVRDILNKEVRRHGESRLSARS